MRVPTLNLETQNELIPRVGVYVTQMSLDGGPFMNAVTNVGYRPTFNETSLTIETFVLDESVPEDATKARLEFVYHLRDERKFDSPDALRAQITVDVARAKKFFRQLRHGHERQRG